MSQRQAISSKDLGDFKVTRVSDTQLSVAPGIAINGGPILFPAAIINIAGAVGTGPIILYYNFNDQEVEAYPANGPGSLDMSQLSGTNFISNPDQSTFLSSSNNNGIICQWTITANVFNASSDGDSRALGINPITEFGVGPGLLRPPNQPGGFNPQIDPNGPTGLWQKWNVAVDLTRGPVATASIDAPGAGYTALDSLPLGNPVSSPSLSDGSSGANFIVDTVDGNGAILTGHIDGGNLGTFYQAPKAYLVSGGTGTGADIGVLTVTPVPAFVITNPDTSQSVVALASALTQALNVFPLPASYWIEQMAAKINSSIVFTGTTTLSGGFGTANSAGPYWLTTPMDLTANNPAVPTDGNLDKHGNEIGLGNAGDSFALFFTATVQNLDQLTAGSLDIWVKYSVLP